jgi:hypothetical protein
LGAFTQDVTQTHRLQFEAGVGKGVAMSVRTCMLALAFLLAGAILFVGVGLGAIVFLSYSNCSPVLGYYGCDIPTAK